MSIMSMTGPRLGATRFQLLKAVHLITFHGVVELHEGRAIGADTQLYYLGKSLGCFVVIHPATNLKYQSDHGNPKEDKLLPAYGYHTRNKHIVNDGNFLTGFPNQPEPWTRGGTAHAIKYARGIEKPVILIWPNGNHTYERWPNEVKLRNDFRIPTLPF